jgi:hypothetical protein
MGRKWNWIFYLRMLLCTRNPKLPEFQADYLHESGEHLTRAAIFSQILDDAKTVILTSLRQAHKLHSHLRKLQTYLLT